MGGVYRNLRLRLGLALALTALAAPAFAADDSRMAILDKWLVAERAKVAAQRADDQATLQNAAAALSRGLDIRAKAAAANNAAAGAVAAQAVSRAETAVQRAQGLVATDDANLVILDDAATISGQCDALGRQVDADRAALVRQAGASQLISEAADSRPSAIAARTAMVAARFARVVHALYGDNISKRLADGMSNWDYLQQKSGEPLLAAVAVSQLSKMADEWAGLNFARRANQCYSQFQVTSLHSDLAQQSVMVGACAQVAGDLAKFLELNGPLLDSLGRALGYGLPIAYLAKDAKGLYDEINTLKTYTQDLPEAALKAAKDLDERQKKSLAELQACKARVVQRVADMQ
jgi:hypothetical protein